MFAFLRNPAALALATSALMFQAPAFANTLNGGMFNGVKPVNDQTLDHIRGGFSLQYDLGQMKLALDMSQISYLNGVTQPAQQITGSSGGTLNMIQNGLNNSVSPSVVNSIPIGMQGALIQNNLDNQVLTTVNTLNITVTSQAFARSVAMGAAAQGALLRFLH